MSKYNAKWKRVFEREAGGIRKIFRQDAFTIEHIGSTAIPGAMAKPVIDIAVIVSSLRKARKHVEALKEIGYKLKDENRSERLFFTKGPEEKRTHYLHVGEKGSGYVEDMILFRDYLREHKEAVREYTELKLKLARKYKNKRELYTRLKETLVETVIQKARGALYHQ